MFFLSSLVDQPKRCSSSSLGILKVLRDARPIDMVLVCKGIKTCFAARLFLGWRPPGKRSRKPQAELLDPVGQSFGSGRFFSRSRWWTETHVNPIAKQVSNPVFVALEGKFSQLPGHTGTMFAHGTFDCPTWPPQTRRWLPARGCANALPRASNHHCTCELRYQPVLLLLGWACKRPSRRMPCWLPKPLLFRFLLGAPLARLWFANWFCCLKLLLFRVCCVSLPIGAGVQDTVCRCNGLWHVSEIWA